MLLECLTYLDHSKIFDCLKRFKCCLGTLMKTHCIFLTIGHWPVVYINVSIQENQPSNIDSHVITYVCMQLMYVFH